MSDQSMAGQDGATDPLGGASQGDPGAGSRSGEAYAPAELENLQAESAGGRSDVNLDAIVDIPVTLSVEIGQTQISIRNLLQLNQGSVVETMNTVASPKPRRASELARSKASRNSLGSRTARIPRPPPPAVALTISG